MNSRKAMGVFLNADHLDAIKIHCRYDKMIPIESFVPHDKNANKHPDSQIALLSRLIRFQGVRHPIIISNLSGKCVAGHGRYEALKSLGFTQLPVVFQDFEDVHQEVAFLVSDNKIQELAETDESVLNALALEMPEDFDLELLGIPDFVIDEPKELGDPDDVPFVDETKVRTKLGDLYELGTHRLMCGDSTDKATVEKLMNGEKADMVFTDPPYKIETDGGCAYEIGKSLQKQGESIEFIADFNPQEFLAVLPTVFDKNKINAYVFCNKELLPEYLNWARGCKYSFNVLIWKKPNPIPIGDSHRPDIEYLILFRRSAIWNNGLSNVNYSRCLEYGRESGLHPTMKPVGLIENEILISSNSSGIVLDLFGGSGSTLIACEKTKRKCFMMELDPHYCDVIVSRWCKYTGQNKIKLNGQEITWTVESESKGDN